MFDRPKYLNKMERWLGKPLIKVLSGQRRTGKSFLLKRIQEKAEKLPGSHHHIRIDMEHEANFHIRTAEDLSAHIRRQMDAKQADRYFIYIDEIQEIAGFERVVRSLAAQQHIDLWITGSNADMLSGELATRLSGRYIDIPVYSLDFEEFCRFHGLPVEQAALQKFLRFGGLPFLIHLGLEDEIVYDYLRNILDTVVYKDVISRWQIRNVRFLNDLLVYSADTTGSLLSAKKISDYLKSQRITVSVNAVLDYLSYLVSAQVLYKVPRYDIRGRKHFEIGEKYYFQDTGIRNAITGYRIADIAQIMENVVHHHLKSHGFEVLIGKDQQREIDFVARRQGETVYVQVAYLLSGPETIEREFGNLKAIPDNYPKIVVSMDENSPATHEGIRHQSLLSFLKEFR
ncbi:MAG: ATP-binding protein [Balneolales bacterium]|nr:ATP-binding protein [Balneolales bacterium]